MTLTKNVFRILVGDLIKFNLYSVILKAFFIQILVCYLGKEKYLVNLFTKFPIANDSKKSHILDIIFGYDRRKCAD